MIKQETIIINGRTLIKTYSDSNKYIIQNETGVKYSEAVDVPNKYTYKESEEDIETEKELENIILEQTKPTNIETIIPQKPSWLK